MIREPVKYNDIYIRIVLGILAAHIIVMFGEERSIFDVLLSVSYFRGFTGSFIIAMLLIQYVYFITCRLDRKFSWHADTLPRLFWQFVIAFAVPAILAFVLAAIFFAIFRINILQTNYLKHEYTLVVIMILALNIYYFGLNSFLRLKQAATSGGQAENSPEIYIVYIGTKNIPLQINSIAYFFHESEMNFVRNVDGEDFLISETLDSVQQRLDAKRFFRVNRKMVVHRQACQYFETLPYGKLELKLLPPLKEAAIISQKRAKSFRQWIGS